MKISKNFDISILIIIVFLFLSTNMEGQKVGINTTAVGTGEVLHIFGDGNKGFMPPKVSTTTGISSPVEGNTVYNTTASSYQVYDGSTWVNLGTPKGAIIMWNGPSVPSGWALCDGNGGRPDLRERFIVGSGGNNTDVPGGAYSQGGTGGAIEVTLAIDEMPSHTHDAGTLTTDQEPDHNHSLTDVFGVGGNIGGALGLIGTGTTNTSGAGAHTHDITGVTGKTGGNASNMTQAHENRPPYYALAFIIKL